MGTQYLLDSNVIIGFLDRRLPESGMVFVSKIVNVVPNISVMSKINETIKLCRQSKIKIPDAIIAATCLVHNYVLLTRNVRDFDRIDVLKITNPWDL